MENDNYSPSKRKWDLAILLGITLFALASRGYGIWEWNLSGDEYNTVMHAAKRYTSFVNPAYYALVLGSFKLFGVSEWSSRLPAMLLGVFSVPVFYLTWRSVFGRYAAFVGALLIIFSNWHLYYSQFSRFYSGVFLFGSLSYFFYYRAIFLNRLSYLTYAILCNIVGTLFHATSFLVTVACLVFSLIVLLSKRALESGYSKRIACIHLALSIACGLVSSIFLIEIAQSWSRIAQPWGYGPAVLVFQTIKYFQLPIVISALIGLIILLQKDVLRGAFFAIGIGVPFLCLLIAAALIPPAPPRYIFFTLPIALMMSAYLCDQVRIALQSFRFSSFALAIILLICILPATISHYTGKHSLNSKQAVAFLKNAYLPGDHIRTFKGVYKYYFGANYHVDSKYLGSPFKNNVEWGKKMDPYKTKNGRVWIILDVFRKPLAEGLDSWLLGNASLVWRKYAKRYDYNVTGIEIWLVESSNKDIKDQ